MQEIETFIRYMNTLFPDQFKGEAKIAKNFKTYLV